MTSSMVYLTLRLSCLLVLFAKCVCDVILWTVICTFHGESCRTVCGEIAVCCRTEPKVLRQTERHKGSEVMAAHLLNLGTR